MTSIGMSSFSLFLRPMEADFGWSRAMVPLPYMFAMLGWGAAAVLFGKLADDYGARRVILGGILLMAAGFFGMSLSSNVWQLSLTYGLMVGLPWARVDWQSRRFWCRSITRPRAAA